jgi:hypothetical protein
MFEIFQVPFFAGFVFGTATMVLLFFIACTFVATVYYAFFEKKYDRS